MSQQDPTGFNNLSHIVTVEIFEPPTGSNFKFRVHCECNWEAFAHTKEGAKRFADEHRRAQTKLHLSKGLP